MRLLELSLLKALRVFSYGFAWLPKLIMDNMAREVGVLHSFADKSSRILSTAVLSHTLHTHS